MYGSECSNVHKQLRMGTFFLQTYVVSRLEVTENFTVAIHVTFTYSTRLKQQTRQLPWSPIRNDVVDTNH